MIKTILQIEEFNDITHIYKLDDHDTVFDIDLVNKIKNIISKKI